MNPIQFSIGVHPSSTQTRSDTQILGACVCMLLLETAMDTLRLSNCVYVCPLHWQGEQSKFGFDL